MMFTDFFPLRFFLFLAIFCYVASQNSFAKPIPRASLQRLQPIHFTVGSFSFLRPQSWNWETPSFPMRKAQLSISGKNKTTALVTFFTFGPGQGGTVEANITRWAAQFSNSNGLPVTPTTTIQKTAITTITFVSASGTFAGGTPGGPAEASPGFALRGAIMENAQGDVYVKMTGPEDLIKEVTPAFDEMILNSK